MRHHHSTHSLRRRLLLIPATVAVAAGLNIGGSSVFAETPPFEPVDFELALPEDDPEPEPDPTPNPAIPDGPGELTDDPCDPVEGSCGNDDDDPDLNPDLPPGPGDVTQDPCFPDEGPVLVAPGIDDPCDSPDPEDPETPETPDPETPETPETPECGLDEICTATPTFTG